MNTGTIAGVLGVGFILLALKRAKKPIITNETKQVFKCKYRDTNFPLKYGSCGVDVKILQRFLNRKFGVGLIVDGAFGPLTKTALQSTTGRSVVTKLYFQNIQ